MAVIAVYSMKGGVGKTTLAVELARRSALVSNRRTLLWDLDPQGGSGFLLGQPDLARNRAVSLFQRDGKPRQLVEPTRHPKLDLLPADSSLRQLPLQLARIGMRTRLAMMTKALKPDYERIVLDCPAGLGELSDQVLAAADLVIVPLPASPLSSRALEMLRKDLLQQHHRHPPILPVLSMYDARRPLHQDVRAGLAANWPVIPLSTHLEQLSVRHSPLDEFAPKSPAAVALRRLWAGIEAKLGSPIAKLSCGGAEDAVAFSVEA
ncbi:MULTISPECIES: ParA family protein [unclassified Novosphingobium]|uniref:ParA family protein n=1 Tax=unclassified Novosphingobium TaxID=2644732 RepID=UPI0025D799D4|nr:MULTISPECIES: ParA family protein [unclassified Novosphingobium]HQV03760.1 ParA family protein [Novosphingobium sp.]